MRFLIFGDENRILPLIRQRKHLLEVTEITHTDFAISNEMKVSSALRKGRQSSMQLAIDAVRNVVKQQAWSPLETPVR